MKHSLKITIFLISLFLLSQVFGLFLIMKSSAVTSSVENNQTITQVSFEDTALGPRPETTGFGSFIYVILGVTIGTIILLVLVKFGRTEIWRIWFFLAVWMAITIALGVLIKTKLIFDYGLAILLGLLFAIWKIFKPNIFVHNFTEVLIYSGIAVLISPIFDLLWVIILLVAISLYDMYAVWKSKHMIKMAQFQTKSNVFAGLMIPYTDKNSGVNTKKVNVKLKSVSMQSVPKNSSSGVKTAILGGGDIAFPLIFTGVVFQNLLLTGLTKSQAYLQSSIIIATTTLALGLLLFLSEKGKFYPAMPFVSVGCIMGWLITLLL